MSFWTAALFRRFFLDFARAERVSNNKKTKAAEKRRTPHRSESRTGAIRTRQIVEHTYPAKLLIALFEQFIHVDLLQLPQIAKQIRFERVTHGARVAVGAAERLGNDVVDDAELEQVAGGQAQGVGGERLGLVVGGLPENAGAAFGTDHGIIGVFEHADAVADADAERAAGAPFPDNNADNRRRQAGHLEQIDRDELSLAALLGADARIRPRRVDQADDRQAELRSETHLVERFAIALGMSATVQALVTFLEGMPLLVADEQDAMIAEAGGAGAPGGGVADGPVAVQLDEILENHVDVVERLRAVGVTRDEHRFPRR